MDVVKKESTYYYQFFRYFDREVVLHDVENFAYAVWNKQKDYKHSVYEVSAPRSIFNEEIVTGKRATRSTVTYKGMSF